jgi:hypothetical protein
MVTPSLGRREPSGRLATGGPCLQLWGIPANASGFGPKRYVLMSCGAAAESVRACRALGVWGSMPAEYRRRSKAGP